MIFGKDKPFQLAAVSLQLQRRFRRDGGIESLNRTHAMAGSLAIRRP